MRKRNKKRNGTNGTATIDIPKVTIEKVIIPQKEYKVDRNKWELAPSEDYDANADVKSLLTSHGFKFVKEQSQRQYFLRSGNPTSENSGNFHTVERKFYTHSSSTVFPQGEAITPTTVYALLEHNGDKSKACIELINKGYGRPAKADSKATKPNTTKGNEAAEANKTDFLAQLLEIENKIETASSQDINFKPPLLIYNDVGIIRPNTINVIQGAAGSHKSRLVEMFVSAIITNTDQKYCGFHKRTEDNQKYSVLFVDTERNITDQLPYAMQKIKENAGFGKYEKLDFFSAISLIPIPRKQRFEAIRQMIEHKRATQEGHLLIVLDVLTDCILNFNDATESLQLIDLMNLYINEYDVTFLTVIHENPGQSLKARGHLGTEALNKASAQLRIGFEKDSNDLLKVKFLKTRMSRRPDDFHLIYCDDIKGLAIADDDLVEGMTDTKVAPEREVLKIIAVMPEIKSGLERKEIARIIADAYSISIGTATKRIKEVVNRGFDIDGHYLQEIENKGKSPIIRLVKP